MGPDKKKIAAASWKRGSEAMAREQWDFAIDMFSQCVALVPDNLMYRQMLRGVEGKKYGNNKTGARMAGARLMTVRGKIKKAKMQKHWDIVDQEAERGLQINPWDAQLNADLAEACVEREFPEVALFAYEKAVEADQNNTAYLRPLARLLEERGEYDRARAIWGHIRKIDPNDTEARRKEGELLATKAGARFGENDPQSTKDLKPENQQPVNAYDADRPNRATQEDSVAPGESVEHDLLHAIRKDPQNHNHYLKLADHYRRENRFEDAMAQFQKALEISGGDQNIREQLEDVELLRMRQNLDTATERYKAKPEDESLKQQVGALKAEFYKREVQILSARVDRYPKNLRLKFDLANRLMKFKKWDQAIPLLQQSTSDTRLETEARVLLGECFLNDNKKPLAARQFETALKAVNVHEHPEMFCTCHYVLGRLTEEKGEAETAINHYSEILSIDYNYRDARNRLEKLQGG